MDAVGSHMNCNRVAGDRKRKDSRRVQSDVPALPGHPDSHQGRAGTPDWESMPASQACARKSQGLFSKPQTLPPEAKSSDFAPKPKVSPVLELRGIRAGYGSRPVLFDVNLSLERHKIVGLVGESGSGKSTLARVAAGLLTPEAGEVLLDGAPLTGRRSRAACRKIQMVFQNPEGSLNPRRKVGQILTDAMLFHGTATRADAGEKARELLRRMELPEDALHRLPRAFSGGQKQRVALARALSVEPEVLIADEPTSALDVSVQLRMLRLIRDLREERALTILFISHDLGVIYHLCDEVVLLREGRVLEHAPTADFFARPSTPYGRRLLDAVPRIELEDAQ